jgi:hypothetical protein
VVACFDAVLVGAAPAGPVPRGCAAGDLGDQVCQGTADLAERNCNEAACQDFWGPRRRDGQVGVHQYGEGDVPTVMIAAPSSTCPSATPQPR